MATQNVTEWRGQELLDNDGEKLGTIDEVYLDRQTASPSGRGQDGAVRLEVDLRPDGGRERRRRRRAGRAREVPVKDAPNIDPDGELSTDEERRLYEHYGRGDYDDWGPDSEDRTGAVRSDTHAGEPARDADRDVREDL